MFNNKYPFDFSGHDTWTMFHSYCFDFLSGRCTVPCCTGKIGHNIQDDGPRPGKISRGIEKGESHHIEPNPSAFYNLAQEELRQPDAALQLRYVIFGGEALKPVKLKEWKKGIPGQNWLICLVSQKPPFM